MRALLPALVLAMPIAPAAAQQVDPHAGHREEAQTADPHAGHGADPAPADSHGGDAKDQQALPPGGAPPEAAYSGPRHAADRLFGTASMADARRQLRAEHGGMRSFGLVVERLEMPIGEGDRDYAWEAQGWYGGDIDRIRIKTEGAGRFGDPAEAAELRALWSHAFTAWLDLQAGVRYDWRPEPDRGYLVLGIRGLMPYLFEVEAAAFVSGEGDLSARFEAEYDLLVTQRLVLQPRAEVEVAFGDVPELRVGSGIGSAEVGLRLRYELTPELAPYAGVQWERKLGETADFARREGVSTNELFMVAGLKFRF